MARELGDAQFGVYIFAFSVVTLVTALGDFGQDKVLTREVTRDRAQIGAYFLNTLGLKLALALPALAITVSLLVISSSDRQAQAVIGLLGLAVIVDLLTATVFATYQAFERLEYIPITLITERLLAAIVGIVALLLGANVVVIAAILLGAAIGAFLLALLLLFSRVVKPVLALDPSSWMRLLRASAPIGLAGIFAVVLFRADSVLLAVFKSKDVVGNYGAAYRLFEATLFISWAIGAAVFPSLARSTRESIPSVSVVFGRSLKLLLALTLPVAVSVAILARPIVGLVFGNGYPETAGALQLLAPAIALYPAAYLASYLLISQDIASRLTFTYAATAAFNVTANLVAIPLFSMRGAALVTSLSELLSTGLLLWFGRYSVERSEWTRALVGPVGASALTAVVFVAFRTNLFAALTVGAGMYLTALVVFEHSVYPQDATAFWNALRPRMSRTTR